MWLAGMLGALGLIYNFILRNMKPSFALKFSVAAVLVVAVGTVIWLSVWGDATSDRAALSEDVDTSNPLWIQGYIARRFDGDKILAMLNADQLKVSLRNYYIFNIKSVNELTLTNVKLETHCYPDMSEKYKKTVSFLPNESILSFSNNLIPIKKTGFITRGVIKEFTWKIFNADNPCLTVKARKAYLDLEKNDLELRNVIIENSLSKKLIVSRSASWREKEKVFKIPGTYLAITPEGTSRGNRIKLYLTSALNPSS